MNAVFLAACLTQVSGIRRDISRERTLLAKCSEYPSPAMGSVTDGAP